MKPLPENTKALKAFLDERAFFYESKGFVSGDPIQIPHGYTKKEDVEIAAFLTSVIAWGRRRIIIANARRIMALMDYAPYDFILHSGESDRKAAVGFVHRTFNADDLLYFLHRLQAAYRNEGGLEELFMRNFRKAGGDMKTAISGFKQDFFRQPHFRRTEKHLPDPLRGSAAKRFNMFLRWMVRPPDQGVDFGIWPALRPAQLYVPLDVHTATVARKLGMLRRKQNDWKALEELMVVLRLFDGDDPVKYDFALFGMGEAGEV